MKRKSSDGQPLLPSLASFNIRQTNSVTLKLFFNASNLINFYVLHNKWGKCKNNTLLKQRNYFLIHEHECNAKVFRYTEFKGLKNYCLRVLFSMGYNIIIMIFCLENYLNSAIFNQISLYFIQIFL